MPFPLVPILASAAAGAALFFGYERIVKPKLAKAPEGPLPGTVSELAQGITYAVQVALAPGTFTRDSAGVTAASGFLRQFFQGVGFDLGTSQPALRDKENADKFAADLTSAWIFTAKWTRPEKFVGGPGHPAIGMTLFTPLPTK
jgi:hypothetical protein